MHFWNNAICCCAVVFSAFQLSNDSQNYFFIGSESPTVDSKKDTGLAAEGRRQETQLTVDLGDTGSISVEPRREGDVTVSQGGVVDSPVLDVLPDNTDAECVVRLRSCSSCWISLTAVITRVDESPAPLTTDDVHYPTTASNANDSNSNVILCQLWYVTSSICANIDVCDFNFGHQRAQW